MRATTRLGAALLAACAIAGDADAQKPLGGRAAGISTQWYKPAQSNINDLDSAAHGHGVYGFIYNSSITPHGDYGAYNWCNMPHVRRTEYVVPPKEYELQYVELMQRHHKRTPYASNAFPVESYQWNCEDAHLFLYGERPQGPDAANVYRSGFISPINPFVPSGWIGTCQFPQISDGGLVDSWQHGADIYGVYHDLLGFLPGRDTDFKSAIRYRVTNNVITSQVAGMVINGMWGVTDPYPLMVQAAGVDGLEPQYSCPASDNRFNNIKSNSNPAWKQHFDETVDLYKTLDDISGVPPTDGGFHASFDHYYDNLSARQCHNKPLPCKLVNGANSTTCVTQELADNVYRLGNWEYSQIYRDSPSSLPASAASLGVWVAELAGHLRDFIGGSREVKYFHNVAHDGSVSRLLSILQIDEMVWPGMGSEVVFELYRNQGKQPAPTSTVIAPNCSHDNCLRYMIQHSSSISSICSATAPPQCQDSKRLASACSCLLSPTKTASNTASPTHTTAPSKSGYYMRVLFGGKVLKSSHPALDVMDMLPVEVLLEYFDALVGQEASLVKANCQS